MNPDPKRVEAIFAAALEKSSASERSALLDEACAGDAALRQRVEALLKAHAEAGGFLFNSAVDLPEPRSGKSRANTVEYGDTERVGVLVAGRFKLLEQVGEGGMGTVWVAEQMQPVRRKVALKLIKAGMDSKTVLARFEAERQALAMMDHPNIAKVLDGGTTETGRPFFVMEFVKGIPLTKFCDDARLSIAERLALFTPICHAVQHAHQKGIIHRDLKPSNILVCLYDGNPVPKVIDFGLAKALHHSLTEQTLHTGVGQMMGTPLYMSPEQAEVNNLDVDTRSDIYSLGVILYELLTGTTPLEPKRFKEAAWQEMLRLIKERGTPQAQCPAERQRRLAQPGRPAQTGPGQANQKLVRRTRLDRDESPGKRPRPPLRNRPVLLSLVIFRPIWRMKQLKPVLLDGLSAAEVCTEAPGGPDDGCDNTFAAACGWGWRQYLASIQGNTGGS